MLSFSSRKLIPGICASYLVVWEIDVLFINSLKRNASSLLMKKKPICGKIKRRKDTLLVSRFVLLRRKFIKKNASFVYSLFIDLLLRYVCAVLFASAYQNLTQLQYKLRFVVVRCTLISTTRLSETITVSKL